MLKVDFFVGKKTNESFGINRYRLDQFKSLKNVDKKILGYNLKNKILIKYYNILDTIINIYYIKKDRRKNSILHLGTQGDAIILNFANLSPVISNCLDLIPLAYPKEYSYFTKFKNYFVWRGLKKSDFFIALSEFTKKDMIKRLKINPDKIMVAYASVDLKHFRLLKERKIRLLKLFNLNPKYKYIAYIGNEEKRMNIFSQLIAFKKAKKEIKNLKFIKAGKPNTALARENLKIFIEKEGLKEDVIFLDYIDEKLLPSFYNCIELLLYPISYAGFGLPPLEAMACGCPIITSNKTSLPEVVGNTQIIIEPSNTEQMAEKIKQVLKNKKLKNKMIKEGLIQAKKFTLERCGTDTEKAYLKFISSQK